MQLQRLKKKKKTGLGLGVVLRGRISVLIVEKRGRMKNLLDLNRLQIDLSR